MRYDLRRFARRPGRLSLCLLLLLAFFLGDGLAVAARRYQQGERIQVTGLVADREGRPLSDVRVVLEASRSYFSIRELRRTEKDIRRVSAVTNARGEYTLEWPWDSFFNRFDLVVGVPVRKGTTEKLQELQRTDMTDRMLAGSPVVAALTVENAAFLQKLRQFVASVKSDDERRVYDEMGKPDEVKTVHYPDSTESTWWYFGNGRAYRFRDGHLEQVIPFDPVTGS
ncbi:MAG TPA: hypothetical protein VHU81_02205 [Thermoanaerobaculia bacterium]|nr:hypothetical protein [Thermoanaerobaculia bacterium]